MAHQTREEKKYFCTELAQCRSLIFASSCTVLEIHCRQLYPVNLEKNACGKRQNTRIPGRVASLLGNSWQPATAVGWQVMQA